MIAKLKLLFTRINKIRIIIRQFRNSAAISLELAKNLKDLGIEFNPLVAKLIRKGIIKNDGGDSYYLDEKSLMVDRMNKAKWGMVILFLILGFIFLYLIKNQA